MSGVARVLVAMLAMLLVAAIALLGSAPAAQADEWRVRQWYLDFLKAAEVHQITQGEGITVAVVDSGVDGNHADLKGNVLKGRDFTGDGDDGWRDTDGHGTAMASLIAGHGHGPGNRDGIIGLAPKARILPFRDHIGDPDKEDPVTNSIKALDRAAYSEAKVINFSGTAGGTITAVETALAQDIVFVAGAGNTSQSLDEVQQPASYPGVVAVSGLDRNGNFAKESVHGPEVVLSAPAVGIAAAGAGRRGTYNTSTGTSNATALVSATAALIRAKYPDLSANGVINRLIKTADDKGPPGRDPQYGFGVVNPLKALTADIPDIDHNPLIEPSASPSSPATSSSAGSGGEAGGGNNAGGILLMALAIVGTTLVVVVGGIYLIVRRNRSRTQPGAQLGQGPQPPTNQPPGRSQDPR